MASGRFELPHTVEHKATRSGRWLRDRRLKLALGIAIVEGILVVLDVIPGWVALVVGVVVVAFYVARGRELRSDSARQASWIAAASQVLVALVPVLMFVVTAAAILALAVLAVMALVLLFADRR